MTFDLIRTYLSDDAPVKRADAIRSAIERAVGDGKLAAGDRLPTVRRLAEALDVSPTTVASAYRDLRGRGLITANGRRGTRVSPRPVRPSRRFFAPPPDARDLSSGNPDPDLLPPMAPALRRIDPSPRQYGDPPLDEGLGRVVARTLGRAGVPVDGGLCPVSGAMDGLARLLGEHARPGDRVILEDPAFSGVIDLLEARGLVPVPAAVDDEGVRPEALETALRGGARALVATPRAQSPTGAALTAERAAALRDVLGDHPDVLIIEDDHANRVTDVPLELLHDDATPRWAHVHSFSKPLNPDLRLAVVTGDEATVARIRERMVLAERWVSHVLQRIVAAMLEDEDVRNHLRAAARTYTRRRRALTGALAEHGIAARGASGFNVWISVPEEAAVVQGLAARGWAVAAGERFRLASGPGIRVTTATLEPEEAPAFADALADVLGSGAMPTA